MESAKKTPQRIWICGCSGAGKSTLGRRLSAELGLPFVELDSLYHLPGWSECPDEEFIAKAEAATSAAGWIVDGNYRKVRERIWMQADTVIFLDYPLPVVFSRVFWRTMKRCATKEELWNGNRERFWKQFLTKDSILWWTLTTWRKRRREAEQAHTIPALQEKSVLRFRKAGETERWVRSLKRAVRE